MEETSADTRLRYIAELLRSRAMGQVMDLVNVAARERCNAQTL
jgi:hypothetical protein